MAEQTATIGWDAHITAELVDGDPLHDLTDEELLTMSPSVIAALITTRTSGIFVADPGATADADMMVRVNSDCIDGNVVHVAGPTMAPMPFYGMDGEIIPSTYTGGLADRPKTSTLSVVSEVAEALSDPVEHAMVHAAAAIESEARHGGAPGALAVLLGRAWGEPELFTRDMGCAVLSAATPARMAAYARKQDSTLLVSWQKASEIRSSRMVGRADAYGAALHVNWRRARVVAEALFLLTCEVEGLAPRTLMGYGAGLSYAVAPYAFLGCSATMFKLPVFDPGGIAVADVPTHAKTAIEAVLRVGLRDFLGKPRVIAGPLRLPRLRPLVRRFANVSELAYSPVGDRVRAVASKRVLTRMATTGRNVARNAPRRVAADVYQTVMSCGDARAAIFCALGEVVASLRGVRGVNRTALLFSFLKVMDIGLLRGLELSLDEATQEEMAREMGKGISGRLNRKSTRFVCAYVIWRWLTANAGDSIFRTTRSAMNAVLASAKRRAVTGAIRNRDRAGVPESEVWAAQHLKELRAVWAGRYSGYNSMSVWEASLPERLRPHLAIAGAIERFRSAYMALISWRADAALPAGGIRRRHYVFYARPWGPLKGLAKVLNSAGVVWDTPSQGHAGKWIAENIAPLAAKLDEAHSDPVARTCGVFHRRIMADVRNLPEWMEAALTWVADDFEKMCVERDAFVAQARASARREVAEVLQALSPGARSEAHRDNLEPSAGELMEYEIGLQMAVQNVTQSPTFDPDYLEEDKEEGDLVEEKVAAGEDEVTRRMRRIRMIRSELDQRTAEDLMDTVILGDSDVADIVSGMIDAWDETGADAFASALVAAFEGVVAHAPGRLT